MSGIDCSGGTHFKMEATLSLIDKTQADPVTAEDLCRVYAPKVCRFAAMATRNAADAEDLAQEALLRAVKSLRSYDSNRGSMDSWLWRIVTNAAHDAASRRERVRQMVARLQVLAPREVETVEDAAITRLGDNELHAQLRRLPWRDRTLLALRYGADLDMEKVGAGVGLSAESAARATRRALARLRARLVEDTR